MGGPPKQETEAKDPTTGPEGLSVSGDAWCRNSAGVKGKGMRVVMGDAPVE